VRNDQSYGEVAGEGIALVVAGEAIAPASVALFILALVPWDVFVSALAAFLACRLQRRTLAREIFISEAICLVVLP
jgi:hypothetical protein